METPTIQTPIELKPISHGGADMIEKWIAHKEHWPCNEQSIMDGYKAGITKRIMAHVLRYCLAIHFRDNGTAVRFIQELLGHKRLENNDGLHPFKDNNNGINLKSTGQIGLE